MGIIIGDDGTSKEAVSTGKLNQENEHIYNLWCSGRVCCEGMLIQLKVGAVHDVIQEMALSCEDVALDVHKSCCLFQFLKRQDLLNVLARMMRPACDQVVSANDAAIEMCLKWNSEHQFCCINLKVDLQSQSSSY